MEALAILGLALGVSVAGGLGSVLRLVFARWNGYLPWGILLSNSLASGAAGFLVFAASNQVVASVLISGLLGGLSTFSSWAAATAEFQSSGQRLRFAFNWIFNLVIPMAAASIGVAVGGLLIN
jgi:CrcB protein